MPNFAAIADKLIEAYNAVDYDGMRAILAPDLDFAHHNRGYKFDNREDLLGVMPAFATRLAPDRRFLPPERVTASGNVVVHESIFTGNAKEDIPGWARAGEEFRLKICSVFRFDDSGRIVEWKDHG